MKIEIEQLVGIKELSKQMGINPKTIYKKIRERKFPEGLIYNGRRKFKPNQIIEYFNGIGVEVVVSEV